MIAVLQPLIRNNLLYELIRAVNGAETHVPENAYASE